MSAIPTFDLVTQPAVHMDDLPSCCGDCHQGRVCCPHPLVCAGIDGARRTTAAEVMDCGMHRVTLADGRVIEVTRHVTPTGSRFHELGWAISVIAASVAALLVITGMALGWIKP